MSQYPSFARVRQHFERPRLDDVAAGTLKAMEKLDLGKTVKPGQSVALTAGSRGISNIPVIIKSVADHIKRLGAKPFIVPTMGSHGGGAAEGQREIIESYGITEEFTGVPIRASMEVVDLGATADGYPVVVDKLASEADHVGVVGRVKPHTGYYGKVESGILKMMMIGLGKHVGALEYHRILLEEPYEKVVRSVGRHIVANAPITFGVGIVENAYEDTALVEAIRPEDFEAREEVLLTHARKWLAGLPYRVADLLIVDEIGKNVSGSGMDTNVVGRKRAFRMQPPPEGHPEMRLIFVRGLTDKTHGNAAGIGLADFTTERLIRSMNYRNTVINCLTGGYPEGAFTPVHFESDREVIDAALKIIGRRKPSEARVMRIRNTMSLEELDVSEACLDEKPRNEISIVRKPTPLAFDESGNLPE